MSYIEKHNFKIGGLKMLQKMMDREHVVDLEQIKLETGWPEKIYRRKTLAKMFDVGVATISLWAENGILPKPFKMNQAQYALGWKHSDIIRVFSDMKRIN